MPHALHPPAHDAVAGGQSFDDLGKPVRSLPDDDGTARDDPAVVDEPDEIALPVGNDRFLRHNQDRPRRTEHPERHHPSRRQQSVRIVEAAAREDGPCSGIHAVIDKIRTPLAGKLRAARQDGANETRIGSVCTTRASEVPGVT